MRRLGFVRLAWCLALAAPTATYAQGTPATTPPPAAATQAPAVDVPVSLFEIVPRQFELGGRFTSESGDPARFQRYGDYRDGLLFTKGRYAREDPAGAWFLRAAADNVGWRDQRFAGEYQRTGLFTVSGFWDQIPQFYSVDTATPYTSPQEALILDDATQRAIQNGQANLNAYVPLAPQFDLRERRDIGNVRFKVTPTPQLDLTAAFTTTKHSGELPWGASFGFSNDVEVALPYDSRTNEFSLGTEWTNTRNMLRVSYDGSWFDNLDDTLVWDSPLDLDDGIENPGRGRMSLWPSNSAQTLSVAGYTKLARGSRLTGAMSFGFWSNNEPLQPFTINTALPQIALPRSSAEAEAQVFSTNLNFVSRPVDDWSFNARFRHYGYDNQMPQTTITEFVSYDSEVGTSTTGGPELYAHSRTTFDADATWGGLPPVSLTVGYSHNGSGHDFRIFESTGETVFRLAADAVGTQRLTFRAQYELASRSGSGLNEDLLLEIHEQPALRHYDVANRTRNRFSGQVDFFATDVWTFSVTGGVGQDDYDDSYFGLQESTFREFGIGGDFRLANGFGAGLSYNYERYAGLQQSRSASPGQEMDPMRDWTVDSKETVDYFSVFVTPPALWRGTEVRLTYDYSFAEGSYFYTIVPGGPLTPPNQLPNVYNKLQQLHLDARYRLTNRAALTFSYLYEPFRVYDFAFDPTVVNGIVQPSSLVMGYVYRPYTAHSTVFGLKYFW
jgi:MtrB/PioB family decaheme-associated outer membrane protein